MGEITARLPPLTLWDVPAVISIMSAIAGVLLRRRVFKLAHPIGWPEDLEMLNEVLASILSRSALSSCWCDGGGELGQPGYSWQ